MKSVILKLLSGFSPSMIIFFIAMLPIFELRGAIPLGIMKYRLSIQWVFPIAVIGNILPLVPILLFLGPLSERLQKYSIFDKFFTWLFTRTRRRSEIVERLELLGLILFVAIPLPMTGGWTGSVAAFLFNFGFWKSFTAITIGVLIAGIIVSCASMGILNIYFII
ncbi:MAG: COG2426 family protein [bacterium]